MQRCQVGGQSQAPSATTTSWLTSCPRWPQSVETDRPSVIQTWQTSPDPLLPPIDVSDALVSDTRGPSTSELSDLDKLSRASVKAGCGATLVELWEDHVK